MSAFVCDPEHIKQLSIFAIRRRHSTRNVEPYYVFTGEYAQLLAQKPENELSTAYADLLYQENIKSVSARYPGNTLDTLPGPCEKPEHLAVTVGDIFNSPSIQPVAILKMCDCLEYQSCETSDYRESPAFTLLDRIRAAAIRQLPGYDDAPWEYTGPEKPKPAPKAEPQKPEYPPITDTSRNAVTARIKAALKKRSGLDWSVTGGRGTDYGWIKINAPKARLVCYCKAFGLEDGENCDHKWPSYMSPEDRARLGELLGLENVHGQGVSIPASTSYYEEYIDRAEGRAPRTYGQKYWD
jgi:hypothetical protein